ncbi:MAG: PH domain-containing protein [Clostridia bacterium]|nr:PH domain-containing protein [Clostridia bacterium]MBR7033457.1 PH domain-containing protein [Clostridia bacterium]
MGFKGDQYKWKDRKRHLGMPLSFTRYALSEDRLFLETGFFSIKDEEVVLYRIRDISMKRNLWQRMFGVGTVTVISSDKSAPKIELKNVKKPKDVKEMLHKYVEEMKINRRIRIGEYSSVSMDDDDLDDDDTDDIH